MPADPNFVHLHVHSDRSLLDGACRIDKLMKRAADLGMSALALTDHGNLYGAIDFYKSAKELSIKPLIGCEIYLTDGSRLDRKGRDEDTDIANSSRQNTILSPEDHLFNAIAQPIQPEPRIIAPPPPNITADEKPRTKSFYHMGLLARDATGYHNLLKLVSDSHLNGFYYKPRADFETLAKYSKGLIAFSGCLAAMVPQHLLHNNYAAARETTARFIDIYGRENFFIEIQDHGIPEQLKIIPDLLKLATEFNLKVICSNDVHYINHGDAGPHDALLCIQTGSKLDQSDRMKFDGTQFYLKSRDEMAKVFGERPDSLINTQLVAEMCDLKIDFPKTSERYPKFPLAPEIKSTLSSSQYLHKLCVEGLKKRYGYDHDPIAQRPVVAERLAKLANLPAGEKPSPPDYSGLAPDELLVVRMAYEQAIINITTYVDYFLVVWDFIHWAKEHKIPVGPGRGSGAGSLVAYLLEITNIDPIKFGLLFERFLNPERVSAPDFDIDFCMRRREEVINYVREKYGNDCVANIITYGTLGAKNAFRDIARVNNLSVADSNRVAKMIPEEIGISIDEAIKKSTEFRNEIATNPLIKKIVDTARVVEGMVKSTGKHAAGIIITDRPLDEFVPLTLQEGNVTVQYDMKAVGDLGLLKMDFLGLKTLTVISDAVENVRRTVKPDFDIDTIPIDDAKTYELLNAGKTIGVFQLESSGMQNAARQVGISTIDDINAISALFRPGPMQFIPDYARGKKDPSTITYLHPLLEPFLKETYGIIVYQEQVMECARVIAGYSLGGADMLRRAMGKKDAEGMARERAKFVEGAQKNNGISSKLANEIFDLLNKFAQYGFNKSHSAAYAVIAYQTAFLKANYPVQFMAAVLTAELGNAEKVAHFISEAEAMDITVLGPDVNESRENFTPILPTKNNPPSVRFGLGAIKGVGEGAAQKIIAERDAGGPYKNFDDLVSRGDAKAINKRVLEHLAKTGAFDFSGESRKSIFDRIDAALSKAAHDARDRDLGQSALFGDLLDVPPSTKPGSSTKNKAAPDSDFPLHERLAFEKELLGFYVSGHPMNNYTGISSNLDTHSINELLDLGDRIEFRLCGLTSAIAKRYAKKDNRLWLSFTFATKEGSLPINMFADATESYGVNVAENAQVVILGNILRDREGDTRVNVKECYPLEPYTIKNLTQITWILDPAHPQLDDFLNQLREEMFTHPGQTHMEFAFAFEDNVGAFTESDCLSGWKFNPQSFQHLRHHPAVVNLRAHVKPPSLKAEPRRWGGKSKR